MSPKRGGGKKRSKPITSEGTTISEAVTMTTVVNIEEMRNNIECLSEENTKLRKEQMDIQEQNKLILEELDKYPLVVEG